MSSSLRDSGFRLLFRMMDGLNGATIGFFAYGGWAWWANSAHGQAVALRSGLAQGTMSFVVTLSSVMLMRRLFLSVIGPAWLRGLAAACGSLALIYTLIVGVHLAIGTPEIFLTMLPGIPITVGFCAVFSFGLFRLEGAPAVQEQTA